MWFPELLIHHATLYLLPIQFIGLTSDKTNQYRFVCQLEKFIVKANQFCSEFAPVTSTDKFCELLSSLTKGAVDVVYRDRVSTSKAGDKRKCDDSVSGGLKKKKVETFASQQERIQEEIPGHHIGKYGERVYKSQ